MIATRMLSGRLRQLRRPNRPAKMRRLQNLTSPMDERTDNSLHPNRTRFELIFASVWLAVGLFLLPALIFWVGIVTLGPYGEGQGAGMGTFYGDFFGDLAQGEVRAWALALGPLVLITLLRAIFWGARPKPEEPDVPAVSAPAPASARPADARRVEPRIGSE
jgi:hypothetical protein